MERKRSDFEKANLQVYTDLADEAMEETIHGRGRRRGEAGEAIHCGCCFLRVRDKSS
jgi:hypothetical protein